MLCAHLGVHEALVHRVDLDPLAAHLVDQLRGQRGAVAQLNLQLALGRVLVRAVEDQAGGVEAPQRAGARKREERILLHLMLAQLLGVVDQDDPAVGVHVVAKHLDPVLEKEHHRGVVVLATAVRSAVEEVSDRIDAQDVDLLGRERLLDRLCDQCAAASVEQ